MPRSNLRLNFAPITLTGELSIKVGHRAYDAELLRELRTRHRETHVVYFDRRSNVILDIPVVPSANPISTNQKTVDLAKDFWLWPSLLNAALVRMFAGRRDIERDYPVQILGSATQSLITHGSLPKWMLMRTMQEFTPRTLFDAGDKAIFGVLCDVKVRNQILASCKELIARGLTITGRYVLTDVPAHDPRVRPRAFLVGRIASIDGDDLVLDDSREGFERVSAATARLEGRTEVFDWCVHQLLGRDATRVLSEAKSRADRIHSGPGRLEAIQGVLAFLRRAALEAVPGVKFEVAELLGSQSPRFPKTETIPKPVLVFDPAGTRKATWNEGGIKQHGPYDQRTFTPKKLNIAVICQSRFEGQVDAFMAKFLDGMPDVFAGTGSSKQARYGDGFQRRFQLEKANVQTFTADASSIEGYETACKAALQKSADAGIKWDIAFVQIEERFKDLPGPLNPYYATKATLLKNHVPVQSVRLETMTQADTALVFSMNQLALASYAKLGGVPWLLAAEQKVAHELVIGLGSHRSQTSRTGGGERFVGITTVFSSDGNYLLSDRTNVVPFEEYSGALTDTLRTTIQRVREEDNWRNTDRVRLIFHMFKPAKDVEAEAIKKAVEDLALENVTYAFLHIAPDHPFLIFDLGQEGLPAHNTKKGIVGPSRGLHLKLGDKQSLVVFSGASELKKASDGLPAPSLLSLHPNSTFKDMTYLARQAFDFTGHSWRIMFPERFPITIKYSDLIAQRLTGLNEIPHWDNDAIQFRDIGRTLWFL
jgi:hypothetical protein